MRLAREAGLLALLFAATLAGATAQEPAAAPRPAPPADVTLKFEREVFDYNGAGRRDPFTPLGKDASGPRFEELKLRGIIYSQNSAQSVALIVDGSGKIYRVRRGDRIGNSRIVDVGQRRVVISVENFGRARQEILELKRKGVEGTTQ